MFDKSNTIEYYIEMRIEIAIGIIITLLNKGKTSSRELASRFDVSTRTILRYVSILESAGIPIVTKCGQHGGIEIYNTFQLHNMFLTTQEKMSLITACSSINNIKLRKTIQDKLLLIK